MNSTTTQTPLRPDDVGARTATPKRKGSPAIPAVIGIVALLGVGLFLKSRGGAKPVEAPRGPQIKTVKVIPVANGTLVQRIAITGTLRANQNIDLNPKISGRVGSVLVNEGQRVKRGQLLATLDDTDLREAVASARATLETRRVALQQVVVGLPARVAQVNSNIETARAALATSKARYQQALLNEPTVGANARSQVQSAQAGVGAANARLKQARDTARQTAQQLNAGIASAQSALSGSRAQLEQVRNGARAQQVAAAQAQVAQAEAQLATAQAQRRDAQTNLTRQTTLFNGGATAQSSVDAAKTQFDVAGTQVDLAEAQLAAQTQNLSLVRAGSRTEEVRAAESAVAGQQAALRQAQAQRGGVLVAQSQVTESLTAVQQAQEALRTARSNLSTIPVTQQETRAAQEAVRQAETALRQAISNRAQIPVAQQDVPAARAAVTTAQVALNQAENQLKYAQIFSPINGVVNTKLTDEGESAAPGTPLFNLVSLDNVYFEAQVPESQLASIKVGQPAQVTVNAVSDKPAIGYVSDIIRVADARLRQFRVRISLPAEGNFTPGAFARGQLQTQVIKDALLVPDEVVRTENNQNYVFVALPSGDGAVVKKRVVKIGTSANGRTQILSGVGDGDRVITGNSLYQDGDKIKVARQEAGGSSGGSSDSSGSGSGSSDSGSSGTSGSGGSGGGGA